MPNPQFRRNGDGTSTTFDPPGLTDDAARNKRIVVSEVVSSQTTTPGRLSRNSVQTKNTRH
jgi:hypothetical protein